jgi:hypothetical protein
VRLWVARAEVNGTSCRMPRAAIKIKITTKQDATRRLRFTIRKLVWIGGNNWLFVHYRPCTFSRLCPTIVFNAHIKGVLSYLLLVHNNKILSEKSRNTVTLVSRFSRNRFLLFFLLLQRRFSGAACRSSSKKTHEISDQRLRSTCLCFRNYMWINLWNQRMYFFAR